MRLNNLHSKTPLELALSKNATVKSMLQPITKRAHWWKEYNKNKLQPPPPSREGPTPNGMGLIKSKPRLLQYFGGT